MGRSSAIPSLESSLVGLVCILLHFQQGPGEHHHLEVRLEERRHTAEGEGHRHTVVGEDHLGRGHLGRELVDHIHIQG